MDAKVKILLFASNADQSIRLKLDEEIRAITMGVRLAPGPNVLEMVPCLAVRPDDLLQELNVHRPTIVHFSGHGSQPGLCPGHAP